MFTCAYGESNVNRSAIQIVNSDRELISGRTYRQYCVRKFVRTCLGTTRARISAVCDDFVCRSGVPRSLVTASAIFATRHWGARKDFHQILSDTAAGKQTHQPGEYDGAHSNAVKSRVHIRLVYLHTDAGSSGLFKYSHRISAFVRLLSKMRI